MHPGRGLAGQLAVPGEAGKPGKILAEAAVGSQAVFNDLAGCKGAGPPQNPDCRQ